MAPCSDRLSQLATQSAVQSLDHTLGVDRPLLTRYLSWIGGLLPAPGVLIYRRPGVLVERLDGFTDRDVVAQAAAASVTAPPLTGSGA